jgi:hypothetical protein
LEPHIVHGHRPPGRQAFAPAPAEESGLCRQWAEDDDDARYREALGPLADLRGYRLWRLQFLAVMLLVSVVGLIATAVLGYYQAAPFLSSVGWTD